ncbi:MAG: hypothetical protein OIN86_15315 [Candidatus Methanoperedens sp.]|nr:hypothetical protein [Candidatus Methanoperedens sp.]CAG0974840.1 hypothetical protein METP1_01447 [Methanosarcinales archaeon]
MIKVQLFACLVFLLIIIMPLAGGVLEEDWSSYIRIDKDRRDDKGQDITLSIVRRSYSSPAENYTVTVKDFDAQGSVVMDFNYKGKNETIILSGTWDENRTKIILPAPIEAFDKTMTITPLEIVPAAGSFTCCPEAKIKINLIRPELFLEFDKDTDKKIEYRVVNPYANWNTSINRDNPYISPFDSSIDIETNTTNETHNTYRQNEDIPMEISIINYGDAETQNTVLYIDTDGLDFKEGTPYNQLPSLGGRKQVGFNGQTNITKKIILKFPAKPDRNNYTVHAYVKGEKNNNIYYYDDSKVITLLPSIGLLKSVTKDSLLIDRKDVESIYPSIDSDEISRWLQSGDIIVTLGVTNYQNYEIKKVNLYDTLQKQFIIENNSLNWTFDLKPGESKEFTYKILTNRPGKFSLPSALLTYSEFNMTWNLLSDNPSTEVHGPCIQLFKKPDKPVIIKGNNTNISITIRNIGDMPSKVAVNDSLPGNSTLIEGNLHYEGRILPKDSTIFTYMISFDQEGQTELPNPILYVNGKESPVCGDLIKSTILVQKYIPPIPVKTLIVPKKTPVEIPLKTPEIPKNLLVEYSWLEGVIPAFMLLLAVIVFFMLYRKNI